MDKAKIGKLSPIKTYFTLLKGFICTGILYLPQSISEGGWAFSEFAMILSFILTSGCMFMLLACKSKTTIGNGSFTDIGI